MSLFQDLEAQRQQTTVEWFSLPQYLELCSTNKLAYATAAERMLAAIGEPELVDTSKDERLSRIFLNRTIRRYPAFNDFYGAEVAVEKIVGYFKHAAQGLEESKQILYLLGPVGGGKSSLAERLKELICKHPIYVLADANGNISPVFETPLGLFNGHAKKLEAEYGIAPRYIPKLISPWAVKRLKEYGGDVTQFKVVKLYPSQLEQIAVVKTEPGDDQNQDIGALVGKVNIRKLENFDENDADAYSYSGTLCRGNQGVMEFVEMFKAPIKVLHPLLTATQERNFTGTQNIGAMPFNGIVLAHSNEAEWGAFRSNKANEAFIDRVFLIKVPYCLRVSDEKAIYEKMLASSELRDAPCAPETLNLLARFFVLTRLVEPANSNLFSKLRVYDGENIKEKDPSAKTVQEYRDAAGVDEGMSGLSTRFAYKILSKTFNFDPSEVAADPVHLLYVLETSIREEQLGDALEGKYLTFLREHLANRYRTKLEEEIQKAYLEAYDDFGQNVFERYVKFADHWVQDTDFKDPDTGNMFNRDLLNKELEKTEKAAGIANPKDFRHEVVNFVLRRRAQNEEVRWTSYEKMRAVIEKQMFSNVDIMLPIISFNTKGSTEDQKKHDEFVQRMQKLGYTPRQVRRVVEWYMRARQA